MNRIIATTGMAALSVVSLQPVLAQDAKPWNVTATVRSFYDDNYTTLPSKAAVGATGLVTKCCPTRSKAWRAAVKR